MTPARVEAARSTKNVAVVRKPFIIPGFAVAAAACGMRYRDRKDLALIVAESPQGATAAGVFTTNRFCAAPVELCKEHLRSGSVRAVLVNAGIANACTGHEGLARTREMARIVARDLQVSPEKILISSTGVIGQQIILEPVEKAVPGLVRNLRPDAWQDVAEAIMTTDTVPKMACTTFQLGGATVTIGGVAKGSGMIAPNMATMLAFVCTDAAIDGAVLKQMVREANAHSFNCITIDGDTSTNDSLLVLASGRAGNPPIADQGSEDGRVFEEHLKGVLLDLAKQIVHDGEGATKFIEITVSGAPDLEEAKTIAFTIAHSPLVKTAFFGEDANWGRVIAAVGRAGIPVDPTKVVLRFDGVCVFRNGVPVEDPDIEERAGKAFKQKEIRVEVDLGAGNSRATVYTCDFSYEYVRINASYRS